MTISRYAPDTTSGTGGAWYQRAACLGVDTAVFFPVRGEGATGPVKAAKRYCRHCPVTAACLDAAMAEERTADRKHVHGIRGGLTVAERRRLRDRRASAVAS